MEQASYELCSTDFKKTDTGSCETYYSVKIREAEKNNNKRWLPGDSSFVLLYFGAQMVLLNIQGMLHILRDSKQQTVSVTDLVMHWIFLINVLSK